jgi:copper chaperone
MNKLITKCVLKQKIIMQTLKFKTNINCGGCKARVTNFLDSETGIKHWDVDINNPEKILTVEGDNINEQLVLGAIAKAGFTGKVI